MFFLLLSAKAAAAGDREKKSICKTFLGKKCMCSAPAFLLSMREGGGGRHGGGINFPSSSVLLGSITPVCRLKMGGRKKVGNHAQLHFRQKRFFFSKNGGGGFVRERRLPKLKEKKTFFP